MSSFYRGMNKADTMLHVLNVDVNSSGNREHITRTISWVADNNVLHGMERLLLRKLLDSGIELPSGMGFTLVRFVLRSVKMDIRSVDDVVFKDYQFSLRSIAQWDSTCSGMMGIGLWDKLSRLFYIKNAMTGISNTDFLYEPRVIEEVIFYNGSYARLKIYKIWGLL